MSGHELTEKELRERLRYADRVVFIGANPDNPDVVDAWAFHGQGRRLCQMKVAEALYRGALHELSAHGTGPCETEGKRP